MKVFSRAAKGKEAGTSQTSYRNKRQEKGRKTGGGSRKVTTVTGSEGDNRIWRRSRRNRSSFG